MRAASSLASFVAVLSLLLWSPGCNSSKPPAQPAKESQVKPEAKPVQPETKPQPATKTVVVMETSQGAIKIELWPDKAPITVENFLKYVDEKHYDGTIFHRVIAGLMIQGGGFTPDMGQKSTRTPIKNEAANGCQNDRGTIAMARTGVVDSATAQFFINVVNNVGLNHRDMSPEGFGYCVFGKVIEGLDVVDKIKVVPTRTINMMGQPMGDVPVRPVVITSVRRAN